MHVYIHVLNLIQNHSAKVETIDGHVQSSIVAHCGMTLKQQWKEHGDMLRKAVCVWWEGVHTYTIYYIHVVHVYIHDTAMLVVLVWWEVGTRCKINLEESFVIVSSGKMQKENSLFCLVLGLVPNKSLNRIFVSYDLCNLLGYGTNRAHWEGISLNTEKSFDTQQKCGHK